MEILMVQLNVDAQRLDSFFEASKEVARASVHNESGCRRFDIMQDKEIPTRVAFVEVFDDDAAVAAHPKFEHYPKWRAATSCGDLDEGQWERVNVKRCRSVFPSDSANFDSAINGVDESFLTGSLYIIHSAMPVEQERVDDFIEATRNTALDSLQNEQGCLRFDVYQTTKRAPGDPPELWLYEVYANREAFEYHTIAPYTRKWTDTVKDWYSAERPPSYSGHNIWPPDNWNWRSGNLAIPSP